MKRNQDQESIRNDDLSQYEFSAHMLRYYHSCPRVKTYPSLFPLILLMSTVLFLAGCSNFQSLAAESSTQESTRVVEMTIAATPTPTPTPTATPTPSPTPTPEVSTVEELLAESPEISGLSKEIQDEKVVYKAVEGNEYGIEAGEFAGEYNANISIEGLKVGGVALEPEVVTKILNDELAKIPEGEKQMKIVIPLDITEVTAETGFNIENTIETGLSDYLGKETHIMIVEFNNSLNFINPNIDNNQFNTVDAFGSDNFFKKNDNTVTTFGGQNQAGLVPFSCFDKEDTHKGVEDIYYVFDVVNKSKISNFDEEKIYTIGEKTDVQVKSCLSVWFDYYVCQETTIDNLLKLDNGTVIFAYSQETTETSE